MRALIQNPFQFREEGNDRVAMVGPGLRIEFDRSNDRWTHSLSLHAESDIEIARVVESQPDRDDPTRIVSPVYQELQRHDSTRGTSLCLLMTGLWFDHHFSAAVSMGADPIIVDATSIEFDVADRCRAPVEVLSATYVLGLDSGALAEASPAQISWNLAGDSTTRLELIADAPCSLVLAESGRLATRVQVLAPIQHKNFTHRLRYRWRWTNPEARTR